MPTIFSMPYAIIDLNEENFDGIVEEFMSLSKNIKKNWFSILELFKTINDGDKGMIIKEIKSKGRLLRNKNPHTQDTTIKLCNLLIENNAYMWKNTGSFSPRGNRDGMATK